jgi:hypothetical protein
VPDFTIVPDCKGRYVTIVSPEGADVEIIEAPRGLAIARAQANSRVDTLIAGRPPTRPGKREQSEGWV